MLLKRYIKTKIKKYSKIIFKSGLKKNKNKTVGLMIGDLTLYVKDPEVKCTLIVVMSVAYLRGGHMRQIDLPPSPLFLHNKLIMSISNNIFPNIFPWNDFPMREGD